MKNQWDKESKDGNEKGKNPLYLIHNIGSLGKMARKLFSLR